MGRPRRRGDARLRLRAGQRPHRLRDPHRRAPDHRHRRVADRARPRRASGSRCTRVDAEPRRAGARRPTPTRRSRSPTPRSTTCNCQGVLHHTSDPEAILARARARAAPGRARRTIMVYNRDSVWFHLYTAYERMIVEGAFPGLDVERRSRATPTAPSARSRAATRGTEFLAHVPAGRARRATTSAATCRSTSSTRSTRVVGPRDRRRAARAPSTATSCARLRFDSARATACTAATTPASAAPTGCAPSRRTSMAITDADTTVTVIEPPSGWPRPRLRELWQQRRPRLLPREARHHDPLPPDGGRRALGGAPAPAPDRDLRRVPRPAGRRAVRRDAVRAVRPDGHDDVAVHRRRAQHAARRAP